MHQVASIEDGPDSAEVLNKFQQAFSHLDDTDAYSEQGQGQSRPDVPRVTRHPWVPTTTP